MWLIFEPFMHVYLFIFGFMWKLSELHILTLYCGYVIHRESLYCLVRPATAVYMINRSYQMRTESIEHDVYFFCFLKNL